MFGIIYYFSNFELTHNNLGSYFLLLEMSTSFLTVFLSGIFFGLTAYKIGYFSHVAHTKKTGFFGTIGSFFSILVTGCPACSITLASYFGLSWIFAGLPFLGYEVRIVGILIMGIATFYTWKHLEVCEIQKPKKPR